MADCSVVLDIDIDTAIYVSLTSIQSVLCYVQKELYKLIKHILWIMCDKFAFAIIKFKSTDSTACLKTS